MGSLKYPSKCDTCKYVILINCSLDDMLNIYPNVIYSHSFCKKPVHTVLTASCVSFHGKI